MKLWRVVAGVLAAGFIAAGITPAWACACGGYLPDAQSRARAYGENALVQYDAGTEKITLSMAINGSSKKAAWIMPVPSAAKVEVGDDEVVFYRLDQLTRPKTVVKKTYWPFRDLGLLGSRGDIAGAPAPGGGVNVRQQMVLGPFSVARLTGSSGTAVTNWLRTNGYVVPETLAANLTPYLTEKWEIVAVKLAPKRGESLSGVTPPLRLTFASERIVYPMRLSKGATTTQIVTVYVAAAHRVDASKVPDADVKPELLFAGRVTDPALADSADYLTAYTATYTDPSRITDDFTFQQAATDDGFQRVRYVTKNEGLWSTIGVLFFGLLLIGGAAALAGRVLARWSSTGLR